jgi:hypothetical protein
VPVRSLAVNERFGPLTDGRRLFIDSVDLYDDHGEVNYRLRPARPPHGLPTRRGTWLFRDIIEVTDDPQDVRVRQERVEEPDDGEWADHWDAGWKLEVEDDLGTTYDTPRAASSVEDDEVQGSRDFCPAPPPGARSLSLLIYTDDESAEELTPVGEVRVPLEEREPPAR